MSPSKFREKTRKEAHTKRFTLVQKLQTKTEYGKNMESIFYRTFKVHSKVTFQTHSTEHVRLVCSTKCGERTWQLLTCHIENVFEH